jgi:hypothetical protein
LNKCKLSLNHYKKRIKRVRKLKKLSQKAPKSVALKSVMEICGDILSNNKPSFKAKLMS